VHRDHRVVGRVPPLRHRLVERARVVQVGRDDRRPLPVVATSRPRIALVGMQRLENVSANVPPGRSTRPTSAHTATEKPGGKSATEPGYPGVRRHM
jgi:hypothetical protein